MNASQIAEGLQAATGCTKLAAESAACMALSYCRNVKTYAESMSIVRAATAIPTFDHLTIKCTTNPNFMEQWSFDARDQAKDRCDELNRNLAHPAYFIA
jgi:hypothetical protein